MARSAQKPIYKAAVRTAVLIDGGFFHKAYRRHYPGGRQHSPAIVAQNMHKMALDHANMDDGELYRIFYYDCAPFSKKAHNPISKRAIDFSKTRQYAFQTEFIEELKRLRKVAIRLGELHDGQGWMVRKAVLKDLLSGKRDLSSLSEDDVFYDLKQKGVDIKETSA